MWEIEVEVGRTVTTAVAPTQRVCEVAAMFGLGVDERKTMTIVPPARLALRGGEVVFITGASGGGKTTLLRLVRAALAARGDVGVIDFDALDAGDDGPIVEAIGGTLEQAPRGLALAGLGDAFVMLRRASELSDGQRYRFRLARAIAAAERPPRGARGTIVLADEFGATLDRTTARVVAANVRRWVSRSIASDGGGVCFIAATTHDDLLEALEPDVLIVQSPGEGMQVMRRRRGHGVTR